MTWRINAWMTETEIFNIRILNTMEEAEFFVPYPKLKTTSWSWVVILNVTGVVVDCKVLCLLYQGAHKYANNLFASPVSFWLYIGDWIKSRVGGKAALLCGSSSVMALILK